MFDVFDVFSDAYFLLGNGAGLLILIAFSLTGARHPHARTKMQDAVSAGDRLSVDGG